MELFITVVLLYAYKTFYILMSIYNNSYCTSGIVHGMYYCMGVLYRQHHDNNNILTWHCCLIASHEHLCTNVFFPVIASDHSTLYDHAMSQVAIMRRNIVTYGCFYPVLHFL